MVPSVNVQSCSIDENLPPSRSPATTTPINAAPKLRIDLKTGRQITVIKIYVSSMDTWADIASVEMVSVGLRGEDGEPKL